MSELMHYGVLGMKWGVRKEDLPDYKGSNKDFKKDSKKHDVFGKNLDKNWWKSYNKAADIHNEEIKRINEKYADLDKKRFWEKDYKYTKADKADAKRFNAYLKEYDTTWRNTYSNVLLSDFGEDVFFGKRYIDVMPFMDTGISSYLINIEED